MTKTSVTSNFKILGGKIFSCGLIHKRKLCLSVKKFFFWMKSQLKPPQKYGHLIPKTNTYLFMIHTPMTKKGGMAIFRVNTKNFSYGFANINSLWADVVSVPRRNFLPRFQLYSRYENKLCISYMQRTKICLFLKEDYFLVVSHQFFLNLQWCTMSC